MGGEQGTASDSAGILGFLFGVGRRNSETLIRFYACYMCGYQDNSLYNWHEPGPRDPPYNMKPPGY